MVKIIGMDISPSSTGITILCVENGEAYLEYVGTIETPSKVNNTKILDTERLSMFRDSLYEILDRFSPTIFVKESMGANMSRFRSTSLIAKFTGVAEECCQSWWGKETLEIHSYPPSTIKKQVTGNGRAEKEEVQKKVFHLFGTEMYSFKLRKLKGDTEKRPYFNDDETDSTGAIIAHLKKNMIPFQVIKKKPSRV